MSNPSLISLCLRMTALVACSLGQPTEVRSEGQMGGQEVMQALRDVAQLKQELVSNNAQIEALKAKVEQENQALKDQLQNLQNAVPGSESSQGGGAVFIRYGRTTCPNTTNTQLVYTGFMGGSSHLHPGGGSGYLCLPKDPQWLRTKPGRQNRSYMYGSEYQTDQGMESLFDHSYTPNLHDNDAVCSVCHATSRNAKIMIPGKTTCPDGGWTKEYHGYLMTEHHRHANNREHICVDHNPEARPGGAANNNGALLYFVEAICGSLPCPPYIDGNELTCVVCTK